jgi:hypothetical protein
MSKKNRIWIITFLLAVIVGVVWYFWPKPNPVFAHVPPPIEKTPTPSVDQKVKTLPDGRPAPVDPDAVKRGVKENFGPDPNAIMAFANALMKPFSFWGKVVDQQGSPVPNASVGWGANNNPDPNKSGTRGQTTSDAGGMFSINSHGIGVYVEVSKEGYYRVPTPLGAGELGSYGGFKSAGPMGNTDRPMGTKDAPTIFVLRKMGEAEVLLKREGSGNISKNGTPTAINLESGRVSPDGDVKIECWVQDQGVDTTVYNPYDWRCTISVPGGGLIERTDAFEFMAPADGYRQADEIQMSKAMPKWKAQVSKEYFVKLPNGNYGRLQIRVVTGPNNFVRFESYLNPTPGSQNLEYDPAKKVP